MRKALGLPSLFYPDFCQDSLRLRFFPSLTSGWVTLPAPKPPVNFLWQGTYFPKTWWRLGDGGGSNWAHLTASIQSWRSKEQVPLHVTPSFPWQAMHTHFFQGCAKLLVCLPFSILTFVGIVYDSGSSRVWLLGEWLCQHPNPPSSDAGLSPPFSSPFDPWLLLTRLPGVFPSCLSSLPFRPTVHRPVVFGFFGWLCQLYLLIQSCCLSHQLIHHQELQVFEIQSYPLFQIKPFKLWICQRIGFCVLSSGYPAQIHFHAIPPQLCGQLHHHYGQWKFAAHEMTEHKSVAQIVCAGRQRQFLPVCLVWYPISKKNNCHQHRY